MKCLFLFHVFNIVMHKWDIQRLFKKQDNKPSGAKNNQKDCGRNVSGILDVQFVTHSCMNASKVCLCCLYFNFVTVLTICALVYAHEPCTSDRCEVNILIKQLCAAADL